MKTRIILMIAAFILLLSGAAVFAADENSDVMIITFDYSENINTEGLSVDAVTQASMAGDRLRETGNLLVMREILEERLGIEAYNIQIEEQYAPDYMDMVGPAQEDKRQERQFTFREEIPDLDGINTIYFGAPIWWYDMPQPVIQFFKEVDLSGKNIIYFSINRGSNNSRVLQVLRQLQPNARIVSDFTIGAGTNNEQAAAAFKAFLDSLN